MYSSLMRRAWLQSPGEAIWLRPKSSRRYVRGRGAARRPANSPSGQVSRFINAATYYCRMRRPTELVVAAIGNELRNRSARVPVAENSRLRQYSCVSIL
jgi:hypothetical protein